jgi:hypothetical protein
MAFVHVCFGVVVLGGCGGSATQAGTAGAAGAVAFGGGGQGSSGGPSSSGGQGSSGAKALDGGKSNGGGATEGGSGFGGSRAGASSGGGASTSGSTGIGGTVAGGGAGGSGGDGTAGGSTACESDSDCINCAYPLLPKMALDCYCATCANRPISITACSANEKAYRIWCKDVPLSCPLTECAAAAKLACVAGPTGTGLPPPQNICVAAP